MTVAAGKPCYSLGVAPVIGSGILWSAEELHDAIIGDVSAAVFDDSGTANIAELLASVAETDFAQEQLASALSSSASLEDWRVGEAIAETYLTQHHACSFPWPDGRDERKGGSSLPGADLVGFHADNLGDRFAFGEIKTSGEKQYPPQIMYGRTGLKQQLEDLRDSKGIRDGLMKYLGHRAANAAWIDRYKAASKRYLGDSSDIQLYGMLVRDVDPHEDDLRARVEVLHKNCPGSTRIELFSLYLEPGSIAQLAVKALSTRSGGGT